MPFTSSTISQAAAIASLQAVEELMARTDAVVAERRRVSAELAALGYTFPPRRANFVWLPLGDRTAAFTQAAAQARCWCAPTATTAPGSPSAPRRERRVPAVRDDLGGIAFLP